MTDSFADLWNSSAPTKTIQPTSKLGSATAAINGTRRPSYDAFSLLASSSASPSPSRTPSGTKTNQRITPRPTPSIPSGSDAFSGLLSGSLVGTSNTANLSMAERASKAEKERREALLKRQEEVKQQSSTWAGLDTLAKGAVASPQPSHPAVTQLPDDDWLFGAVEPAKPSATNSKVADPPEAQGDVWGLEEFTSRSAKTAPSASAIQSTSLWDLDDFASSSEPVAATSSQSASRSQISSRSNTPGDFDFGNREDGLLESDSSNEDDILGDLGKPMDAVPRRSSPVPLSGSPSQENRQRSMVPSPPPHIIGQIVEMGFSVDQARVALASTDTGLDVQAALETMLANGAGASTPSPEVIHPERRRRHREELHDGDGFASSPRGRHRPDQPRRLHAHTRPSQEDASSQETNYQQQADKLLAQASEIGLSVFNRANAFWNQGKEKVQKVYEERAAAARASSSGRSTTQGRPRWMQEILDKEEAEQGGEAGEREAGPSFTDGEVLPARPSRQRPPVEREPQPQVDTTDLFSVDAPKAYVSPFRRGASSRDAGAASSPSSSKPTPPRVPSPISMVQRKTVFASPSAIAASTKYKASGMEMFKLGRYAEAETAYSSAISQLPSSHLFLVPLHNNRALTRLKTGDTSGAIEDCTTAMNIIGPSYHPTRETKVMKEEDGAGVDLGDALIKAWRRRAEACESKEKWELARKDWEAIAGAEFAGRARTEALNGIGRCRKMLNASGAADATAASRSRPSAPAPAKVPNHPAPRRGLTPPSAALKRLHEANKAAEAEEEARYELKDTVDARMTAWKKGKETNLRALIASLDMVLWPELGWQKVGMAELVSQNQVKIRYTKAIAKLHPDKVRFKVGYLFEDIDEVLVFWQLSANNTTVEQRMIANGVFGSLNDAWNAFKP
ncbi:hypothetical protein EW146_g8412 [Bondarzewia mesenterica]|uniref:UBA domain-containing protein n=1 Tax=Bondarzewia mesenterica TaxID=1095465 RepID=A0A4S4LEJ8_9AGAM|nr:hypothetical protein EW146_g8412 [Bondarzewia mesenterica]